MNVWRNYNDFAIMHKLAGKPVYPTKTARGSWVMGTEAFTLREKMLKLREELLAVEKDRMARRVGTMLDELDSYLESIVDEVEHGKESSI